MAKAKKKKRSGASKQRKSRVGKFVVRVRGKHQPAKEAREYRGKTMAAAFCKALEADVSDIDEPLIYWDDNHELVAIDIDVPEGEARLEWHEIEAMLPESLPRPIAVWITHSGGLRLIFAVVKGSTIDALGLAGVWYLLANLGRIAGWRVEVKKESRHPAGLRGDARCGEVHFFEPTANIRIPRVYGITEVSQTDIEGWLEEHGFEIGKRYSHDVCPFNASPSGGADPVSVLPDGIKCFRCAGSGGRSWASFSELIGTQECNSAPSLYDAAKRFVHLNHQRYVLRDLRPTLPESLIVPTWRALLQTVHEKALKGAHKKDIRERIEDACNLLQHRFVRLANGLWGDADSFTLLKELSRATFKALPCCWSAEDIDRCEDSLPLSGFVGLQPITPSLVLHPAAKAEIGCILVRRPPAPDDPPRVHLGIGPPSRENVKAAEAMLIEILPGADVGYLRALILAALQGQVSTGTPPFVVATGLPGYGKTATVYLAGAALGTTVGSVHVGTDVRVTCRSIGLALESGCGIILADEMGRVPKAHASLAPFLELNDYVTFDAKFRNETRIRTRAVFVFSGSTVPHALIGPEVSRRAVGYRLTQRVPTDWRTIISSCSDARLHRELREALDTIVTDLWWILQQAGVAFDWRRFCFENLSAVPVEELDLGGLSNEERASAIRELYEHWRTRPDAEMASLKSYGRDWLDVSPNNPVASDIIKGLVDTCGADHIQFHAETSEIERTDLSEILGFDSPTFVLKIRRPSGGMMAKFVQTGVMNGHGLPRSKLPKAVSRPSHRVA